MEWEFDKVTFSREFPRGVVTKLLVERAEHGGWELDRVRIGADGTRRVVLRRKIIRPARARPSRRTAHAGPRQRTGVRAW